MPRYPGAERPRLAALTQHCVVRPDRDRIARGVGRLRRFVGHVAGCAFEQEQLGHDIATHLNNGGDDDDRIVDHDHDHATSHHGALHFNHDHAASQHGALHFNHGHNNGTDTARRGFHAAATPRHGDPYCAP